MAVVIITRSEKIEEAIEEALGHVELEPLVRGKLVAVKPNDTWASEDDKTGVTQPDTLRAVLRHLKHFGPRELVVTGGAGAGETDTEKMEFPAMSMREAIEAFTEAAYGERLTRHDSPLRPTHRLPSAAAVELFVEDCRPEGFVSHRSAPYSRFRSVTLRCPRNGFLSHS